MNTTIEDLEKLTPEQRDARKLAAAEESIAGQRKNTEETRKGKTAQRGDTYKELEQKELTGQINLVKFWGGAVGQLAQQSAIAFEKEDQEVIKITMTAAGFLSSTALGAFEAHRTLGQIQTQKESLGQEIAKDKLEREREQQTAAAASSGAETPGASGPTGMA